jgi:excisionase family DNA binding protein
MGIAMQPGAGTPTRPLALSAADLARRLGVSLRHLRRLNATGEIPKPCRLGQSVRWPLAEIEAWLAAGAPDRETWDALWARNSR